MRYINKPALIRGIDTNLTVVAARTSACNRPVPGFHFFLAAPALTLAFCNFFWRFGYFVAGFRAVR